MGTPLRAARRGPFRARASAGALALLLAAACTDHIPTEAGSPAPAGTGPAAALACRADLRAGTLECAPPPPGAPGPAAILGGQGLNVRLRSSGLAYDGATLRIDVTVENLTGQALGTTDGLTPTAEGVRVFFANGPTSATGPVAVANPAGEAFFTASAQPYFQYDGLLAPGDTTAPAEWRFAVEPEVQSFQFTVLVSAAVPREGGWLRMSPVLPSLATGDSLPLAVERLDVAGRPAPAGALAWSSADSTIARVSANGTVTGLAPGATRVFATDGRRTSSVKVLVRGTNGDMVAPTVHGVTVSPARVTANGLDSVHVTVRLTDGGTGTRFVFARLSSPSGTQMVQCDTYAPSAGDAADGTFTCGGLIPAHAEGGAWRVTFLWTEDHAENERAEDWSELQAAGVLAQVHVDSDTPDTEAPDITDVAFSPDSIAANGLDSTTVSLRVADAGAGVAGTEAWFRSPAGNHVQYCQATTPSAGTAAAGTFSCRLAVPSGGQPGSWTLEVVRARDGVGNTREMYTAALDSAGHPTVLRVSGPPADTDQPLLTGFSFSPDTVAANGADSVTVTMEVTDAGSGALRAQTTFASPSGQTATCMRYNPVAPAPGTQAITCRLAVTSGGETGQWRVQFIFLDDAAGNGNVYEPEDLEAMGFPALLTVTP
ncbi:MAG TPA: Ig-like domain-containing protein [Longimicrobium sp.]|nr:Ig-like domain-containing protein [Longimicrobium sp.]